jgi:hypothetical protein
LRQIDFKPFAGIRHGMRGRHPPERLKRMRDHLERLKAKASRRSTDFGPGTGWFLPSAGRCGKRYSY